MYAVIDVEKKWKYLRNQYGDEIKKNKSCKSGMGTDEVYVTKWKFFSALHFLHDHVKLSATKTTSNLTVQVYMLNTLNWYVFLFFNQFKHHHVFFQYSTASI
jgi:hypothetical protein